MATLDEAQTDLVFQTALVMFELASVLRSIRDVHR
jgi:hypothetical protein